MYKSLHLIFSIKSKIQVGTIPTDYKVEQNTYVSFRVAVSTA